MDSAWGNCTREPILKEDSTLNQPSLRGDLACRGVWEPQMEAVFDVRVIDADAPSYATMKIDAALKKSEKEKKAKYLTICEERHASFTPLVTSVDAHHGDELKNLMRAIAERFSEKWQRPYGKIMDWVRVRLACAILRASSLCIRRTRRRWRSLRGEFSDGAGLPEFEV